jgi:hypothetical protein
MESELNPSISDSFITGTYNGWQVYIWWVGGHLGCDLMVDGFTTTYI